MPHPTRDGLLDKIRALEARLEQANLTIKDLELKAQELSTILAEVPLFMMIIDHRRQVQNVSHAILKFTHQRKENVLGLKGGEALRCVHHLDSSKGCGFGPACSACPVRSTVQDTIDTGRFHSKVPARLSFIGDTLDERSLLVSTAPLNTPDKQVLVFVEDVTEQDRAERALKNSEQRLANAQKIAHMGSWDWNIVSNELAWSDEIYRIFGVTPQAFDATYEAFLSFVHPGDRELLAQAVRTTLTEKKPYNINHRIIRPDGAERIVHEQGEVILDEAGNAVQMTGTVLDITDREQARARIKQLRGLLPICASCKKIRNDKGYWTILESYLSTHSDVEFSHGICPDCMKALYSDLKE
ncbi:hypothetical protein DSLASN_45830 [Desulfoluna limicola]|uniref:histidine kinase n=1 Tax=Desulfoluna limicola TaxID=2810562 RepID=A0ABN6F9Q0_9BACT|nr:PAS domain-containing protein [Desulfoluna limicola]BCS98951.1 hypothetical protein DSLASN_45830 [Desulfoluna limicola]